MPFQDYGYKPSGITRPKARPTPKATSSSYYSGNEFGSGNIFTETSPGASTVNFGNNNNDNDNDNNSYQAPSLVQAPTVTAPAAPTPAQIEAERQDRISRVFEAAGATLPEDTGRIDRVGRAIDLYSRDIFTTPYVATPDNTQEITDYLQRTAVDDALREALGMPEVYQGMPTQEEPETNIDISVLQGAMMPEAITVEELPDVTVKAGDTLSAIAEANDIPVQDVIDANPQITNPDMIRPGEVVKLTSRLDTKGEGPAKKYANVMFDVSGTRVTPDMDEVKKFAKDTFSNPVAAAAFVATVEAESGTGLVERGYTKNRALEVFVEANRRADGTLSTTMTTRKARLDALPSDASGDEIFDIVYDRANMGNTEPGDGSRYKGRGLLMVTGKDNYRLLGDMIGEDLVENPELLETDRNVMLKASLAYLDANGFNTKDITEDSLRRIIGHAGGSAEAGRRWANAGQAYQDMYGEAMPVSSIVEPSIETSLRPKARD